jgi:Uma2 family endonuclease
MSAKTEATIEDLYKVKGKAELVNGEIVQMSPTGGLPNYAAIEILLSLRGYAKRIKRGHAVGDNAAFVVDLPNRKSFSPDVAYYVGAITMKFFDGAPVFAVEVRGEGDYGPKAEHRMAAKRADYFAAGTQVIWDVDLLSEAVVKKYKAENPEIPDVFRREDMANAEPAVPSWTIGVADFFPKEDEVATGSEQF